MHLLGHFLRGDGLEKNLLTEKIRGRQRLTYLLDINKSCSGGAIIVNELIRSDTFE